MDKLCSRLILITGMLAASMTALSEETSCDVTLGEKIYKKCAACHTRDDSGTHLVGPNLYGLVNRMSGGAADFPYSIALLEAPRKWTLEALDEFLEKPMSVIPGSSMAFAGIRKPHQRAALICYLGLEETP